jgi:CheY-like chemotaxis protein
VALVAEVRPDVALVDLGLPTIDGYEVARRIRAQPEGKNIFLAALTGYGGESIKQQTRAAGFDIHLTKPVEMSALSALLEAPPER